MQVNAGPFPCDTCGYPFSRRDALLRHERNCRPTVRAPCTRCGLPVGGGAQGMTRHQRTQRCSRFAQAGYRESLARRRVESDIQAHRRARNRRRDQQRRCQEPEIEVPATPAAVQDEVQRDTVVSVEDGGSPVHVIDLTSDNDAVQDDTVSTGTQPEILTNAALSEGDGDNECAICCETIPEGELAGCPAHNTRCCVKFERSCLERWLYEHPKCPACQVEVQGRRAHRTPPPTCSVCRQPTPGRRGLRSEGTCCEHVFHFECLYAKALEQSRRGLTRVRNRILCPMCAGINRAVLDSGDLTPRLLSRLKFVDIDIDVFINFRELAQ